MSEERVLPPAGYEQADVSRHFVWGAFLSLLGALALIVLCVLWLFPLSTTDRTLRLPLPTFPAPRLQPSPREDMARFQQQEMQRLNSVGWIDRTRRIAHIPIEDAMHEIAAEGIPGWPAQQEPGR